MRANQRLLISAIALIFAFSCARFPSEIELEPIGKLGALNTVEVEIKTNLPMPSRFFISICPGAEFCSDFCETAILEVFRSNQAYVSSLGYRSNYRIFVAWLKDANPRHKDFFDLKLNGSNAKSPALIRKSPDGSYQVVAEAFFRVGTVDEELAFFLDRIKPFESRLVELKRAIDLLQQGNLNPKKLIAMGDDLKPIQQDPFFPGLSNLLNELAQKASCARDASISDLVGVDPSKSDQNCLNQAKKLVEKATSELERIKSCSGFKRTKSLSN